MNPPDVLEAARRLAEALEKAGFDYAFAGAIALAYWSAPRATIDVDIAVSADVTRLPELLRALRGAGCQFDDASAMNAAERGDLGVRLAGIRVDVFLPVIELSVAALERRVQVPLGDRAIWVLSAEDVHVAEALQRGRSEQSEGALAAEHDQAIAPSALVLEGGGANLELDSLPVGKGELPPRVWLDAEPRQNRPWHYRVHGAAVDQEAELL